MSRLLATANMSTLFSSAWLPFTYGFAKMGWLSTDPNQLPSSPARLSVSSSIPVNVSGTVILLSDRVKILGATLDSNLTMDNHTKSVSKYCFYHIRSSFDDDMAVSVASAIVKRSKFKFKRSTYR